jgi:hypothetical protein
MSVLTPELAERLAGYIVNRRDKRIITFSVLALYAAALLYHVVGPALGAPAQKAALDSIEMLAAVVVVAHIAGGTAQRVSATSALRREPPPREARRADAPPQPATRRPPQPAERVVRTSCLAFGPRAPKPARPGGA